MFAEPPPRSPSKLAIFRPMSLSSPEAIRQRFPAAAARKMPRISSSSAASAATSSFPCAFCPHQLPCAVSPCLDRLLPETIEPLARLHDRAKRHFQTWLELCADDAHPPRTVGD